MLDRGTYFSSASIVPAHRLKHAQSEFPTGGEQRREQLVLIKLLSLTLRPLHTGSDKVQSTVLPALFSIQPRTLAPKTLPPPPVDNVASVFSQRGSIKSIGDPTDYNAMFTACGVLLVCKLNRRIRECCIMLLEAMFGGL